MHINGDGMISLFVFYVSIGVSSNVVLLGFRINAIVGYNLRYRMHVKIDRMIVIPSECASTYRMIF